MATTDKACCSVLQTTIKKYYTVVDTLKLENNTILILDYSTRAFPIDYLSTELIFDKYVSLGNKANSVYLETGAAVLDFNNPKIFFPVGVTYNKGRFSYSVSTYLENYQKIVGGEVRVGLRLFRW